MKTTAVILFITMFFCRALPGQQADSVIFKSLEPYYFHLEYLKEDPALLIDVRQFFEYRRKRLRDAINIPTSAKLKIIADTIDRSCALFLYCTTDFRSENVAKDYYDLGFTKLYSLEGGIVAWRKEKMPVERKRIRRNRKNHFNRKERKN